MSNVHVFTDARIFTGQSDDLSPHNCLVVHETSIVHVGSFDDEKVQLAVRDGAKVHKLQNRLISPSFIDGHMHILLFGGSLKAISLDDCKSLEDVRATIRSGAAANTTSPRLLCQGWMFWMTESKALASDLDDLDALDRPIFITSKDLHFAWCNTKAIEEMGITSHFPDPAGGTIVRDADGNPTGLFSEAAAITLVWPHLARVTTQEQKLDQIREAISTYNQAGYTGVIEMATDEEIWSLLTTLHKSFQPAGLTINIAAHWLIKPSLTTAENIAQVDRAIELHKQYNLQNSPSLRITGIKIICDGVVDACTAALREPYTNALPGCASNADPIWSYDDLLPVVQHADAAGLQCALHAIGDEAVRNAVAVLSTLSSKPSVNPASKHARDRRHRIEHLELTSPEDARKLGAQGITASIQPVHSDPAGLHAWPSLLGPERVKRAFAYAEFAAHGANLAIGTDSPTAPHWPLPNLHIATTRQSAQPKFSGEAVNEHFKLGLGQALRAATSGAAYSCFADETVGTLEVGKDANFVVLDLDWDAKDLLRAKVEQTWFNGRRIYPA